MSQQNNDVSVLRVGPVASGAIDIIHLLRSSLRDRFCTVTSTGTGTNDCTMSDTSSKVLYISNKYFSVRVLLEDDLLPVDNTSYGKHSEDGIILVFHDDDSNDFQSTSVSFDSLQRVHDALQEKKMDGDLLRLCVGVNMGTKRSYPTDKEYEQEYSRRILWCLDHGYEYVEADLSDKGLSGGHDVRDKDGFARIVEAIGGTVWSQAAMLTNRKERLKQLYQDEDEPKATTLSDEHRPNATYYPPNPSFLPISISNKDETMQEARALELALNVEEINSQYVDDINPHNDDDSFLKRKEEIQQERKIDALEGALNQAKRLREMSLSGTLTDDQRKQRASDAAMVLLNMMGLEDDDTDD